MESATTVQSGEGAVVVEEQNLAGLIGKVALNCGAGREGLERVQNTINAI
jgi:hypothetical protein